MSKYSYSDKHEPTRNILMEIATHSRSWADFEGYLKRGSIYYEEINLANGKQLLVFTGSSGYDIAGCSVRRQDGHFVVEDMYN